VDDTVFGATFGATIKKYRSAVQFQDFKRIKVSKNAIDFRNGERETAEPPIVVVELLFSRTPITA